MLEAGRRQAVTTVEDLVTDAAAIRHPLPREQQARLIHLIHRHQDARAAALHLMGDMRVVQLIHDLAGLAQIKIAVEERHRRTAAQRHERQQPQHRDRDRTHSGEAREPEGLQTFHHGPHGPFLV